MIFLILCIASSIAYSFPRSNRILGYNPMNPDFVDGNNIIDVVEDGTYNLTNVGASQINSFNGGGFYCDGGDEIETTSYEDHIFATNGTIALWVNATATAGYLVGAYNANGGVDNRLYIYFDTNLLHTGLGDTAPTGSGYSISAGKWYHVLMTWNASDVMLYVNASLVDSGAYAGFSQSNFDVPLQLCALDDGNHYTGNVNEFIVYNRTADQEMVNNIYASTFSSFVYPTPANGYHTNIQEIINMSCINENNTLWFDDNPDPITVRFDQVTGINAQYTTAMSASGSYYYKGSCDGGITNTTVRTLVYDTVSPNMTLNSNNYFNQYNQSDQEDINLFFNYTLRDNIDLFATEIKVFHGATELFNYTNTTLSGTEETIVTNTSLIGYDNAIYYVNISVSDTHTKNRIKEYDIIKRNSELEFNTEHDLNIKVTSLDASTVDTVKKNDRYLFDFEFNQKGVKTRTFNVYCDGKLYFRNTKYPGHLVCSKDGLNGNWIDFDIEGLSLKPTVTRINNNNYQVTFNNLPDTVRFNSIGGLNIVTYNYQFTLDRFFIDNCSNSHSVPSNATAYTFNFRDSVSLASSYVNASVNIEGRDNFTGYLYNLTTFNICVYPKGGNESLELQLAYSKGEGSYYYEFTDYFDNVTNYVTLYTESGIEQTIFIVQDKVTNLEISGANANIYRKINGSYQIIESRLTDISGRVQFNYVPDVLYKFVFTKAGYETLSFELNPIIFDEYSVFMTRTTLINESLDYDKIYLEITPNLFYNNQYNDFFFTIISPDNQLNSYGYTLTYPGGSTSLNGIQPQGQALYSNFSIIGANYDDTIKIEYFYNTDLSGNRSFIYYYPIITNLTNTSFMNIQNNTYGLGIFERLFITTVVAIFIVGIGALIGHVIPAVALTGIVWGFFVYIGFIPFWSIAISLLGIIIIIGSNRG